MDDPVGKLEDIGDQTKKKLSDLPAAVDICGAQGIVLPFNGVLTGWPLASHYSAVHKHDMFVLYLISLPCHLWLTSCAKSLSCLMKMFATQLKELLLLRYKLFLSVLVWQFQVSFRVCVLRCVGTCCTLNGSLKQAVNVRELCNIVEDNSYIIRYRCNLSIHTAM